MVQSLVLLFGEVAAPAHVVGSELLIFREKSHARF